MRVAYVSHYDARDVRHWSGTGHHIARCLEQQGIPLDYVGPLRNQKRLGNIGQYVVNRYLRGLNDHPQRDPRFLRHYAEQVDRRLRHLDVDLVLSPGSLPIAYLETDKPVVMWTDCTFASLQDYYPKFRNLSARTIRDGHAAEQAAIARCDLLIFSSDWAADSAIHDYGADPRRVRVIPFGANLPDPPSAEAVERMIQRRADSLGQGPVRLFCMGVDWRRKGMDIAVEVAGALNAQGLRTELVLAGCQPEPGVALPGHVTPLGFLSKDVPEQAAELARQFESAHAFILPTRADCFGIVFCEAAALGLPSLAAATGGVGAAVRDGLNGRVFAPDAPASHWAAAIAPLLCDRDRYVALCRSSRRDYQQRLNWDVAGQQVVAALRPLVPSPLAA